MGEELEVSIDLAAPLDAAIEEAKQKYAGKRVLDAVMYERARSVYTKLSKFAENEWGRVDKIDIDGLDKTIFVALVPCIDFGQEEADPFRSLLKEIDSLGLGVAENNEDLFVKVTIPSLWKEVQAGE